MDINHKKNGTKFYLEAQFHLSYNSLNMVMHKVSITMKLLIPLPVVTILREIIAFQSVNNDLCDRGLLKCFDIFMWEILVVTI